MIKALFIYLCVVNVVALVCYGIDKYKAKKGKWRISEAKLIAMAAIGGALGAFLGMRVFHHKTLHLKFRILVPLCLGIWIAVVYFIFRG